MAGFESPGPRAPVLDARVDPSQTHGLKMGERVVSKAKSKCSFQLKRNGRWGAKKDGCEIRKP